MKRSGFLEISLLSILMLSVPAVPGFAQAAQGKAPQFRTQPEYDAYDACRKETDLTKKAGSCQKFVDGFKDSDLVVSGYRMILQSYYQTNNWQLLMATADKAAALPVADNAFKEVAYETAMVAAQNAKDLDKCISYGADVLAIDPENLDALYTVSNVIPQKSATDISQLERAAEMARKALVIAASKLANAKPEEKPHLVALDGALHGNLGLIGYHEMDYKKSVVEFESAIKANVKDEFSHYFLANDYINLMAQASQDYRTAFKAENDAKAAKADQPTVDELAAKRAGLEDDIRGYRDKVIDELAITVAIMGDYTEPARTELTKQWTAKNDNTKGLDEFVNQKKSLIGG